MRQTLSKTNTINTFYFWWVIYFFFILFTVFISYWLNEFPPKESELLQGRFISSSVQTPKNLVFNTSYDVIFPDTGTAKKINTNEGWYVIPIPTSILALKEEKLCIYIASLSHNVEVFVNDLWIGNGGKMEDPIDRNAKHPLLFNFDKKQLLKKKSNHLYIHIKGVTPQWTYLGNIYMASEKMLLPIYEKQKILRINLVFFTTVALIFTSFFAMLLWLIKRENSYYIWYSIAELLWAVHDSDHFIKKIPFSNTIWESIITLSIGWSVLCFIFFIHRYINQYKKKIDKYILYLGLLLSTAFLYQDADWIVFYGYNIWMIFIMMAGIYIIFFMLSYYKKTKDKNTLLMLLCAAIMTSFGFHDYLAVTAVLPQNSPYILHMSSLIIIIVISTLLINQFISSLKTVRYYNKYLEDELSEKEKELINEYAKNKKLNDYKLLNEERKRIMQDIHDGVGGQLVTTLAAMQYSGLSSDDIKDNLNFILQDLRLVIDSLDGEKEELITILGTLRFRLEDLLIKAKIHLVWKVNDLPMLGMLNSTESLNTMRIVQEAITNIIKHADASHITVSTYIKEINKHNYAIVEIKDNGTGLIKNKIVGRGLVNMKQRADKINAFFEINSKKNKGVTVLLGFSC